jgi:hypothetical protein
MTLDTSMDVCRAYDVGDVVASVGGFACDVADSAALLCGLSATMGLES